MNSELLYRIALTLVPHIGPVQARILLQHCEPEEIFHAKRSFLEKLEGIGSVRAEAIKKFNHFRRAEQEIKYIEKNRIRPLFLTDQDYPRRLLHCYDPPTLLYCKGAADLNASRTAAVIGTRNHTDYARQIIEKLIQELAGKQVTVVSGLAYGVDAMAHKSALKNITPTVAVLAHGLDQVYPSAHANLAREILDHQGALLTEFRSGSMPDKHNFPIRNRVVAGISDATIVIETDIRGGSMITAELANGYNKDVFAFPGRTTDTRSAGCNYLIRNNKASLLTTAQEVLETMGWTEKRKATPPKQKELFIELSPEEKIIVALLREKEDVFIDEINDKSGLNGSAAAAALLNLELQNVIVSLPGKRYRLI